MKNRDSSFESVDSNNDSTDDCDDCISRMTTEQLRDYPLQCFSCIKSEVKGESNEL